MDRLERGQAGRLHCRTQLWHQQVVRTQPATRTWSTEKPSGPMSSSSSFCACTCVLQHDKWEVCRTALH